MADGRLARGTLVLVGLAAVAAIPAFLLGSGPQQTDATWLVTKTAAVTVTAVSPAPPTALACQAGGLLTANVPFTWTAPPGPAPSGYTLKWTGTNTGSTTSATTSASVAAPLGSITVSVYADYGNWESVAGTQTRTINGVIFVGWTCG
ncbi:MAG TPA: hypothetical protein VGM38_09080 [Pseudolysinimonas sp.]|jgi:hypothetical protein